MAYLLNVAGKKPNFYFIWIYLHLNSSNIVSDCCLLFFLIRSRRLSNERFWVSDREPGHRVGCLAASLLICVFFVCFQYPTRTRITCNIFLSTTNHNRISSPSLRRPVLPVVTWGSRFPRASFSRQRRALAMTGTLRNWVTSTGWKRRKWRR